MAQKRGRNGAEIRSALARKPSGKDYQMEIETTGEHWRPLEKRFLIFQRAELYQKFTFSLPVCMVFPGVAIESR
jgi:hypothetical protein